VLIEAVTSFNE
jgi:hypothetical protein